MASDPERFRDLGHVAPGPQNLETVLKSGSGVRGPLAYNIQQQRTSPTPVEGDCGRIVGKPYLGITSGLPVIRPEYSASALMEPPFAPIIGERWLVWKDLFPATGSYRSFANSAFACLRTGMSGSASFQSVRNSL